MNNENSSGSPAYCAPKRSTLELQVEGGHMHFSGKIFCVGIPTQTELYPLQSYCSTIDICDLNASVELFHMPGIICVLH